MTTRDTKADAKPGPGLALCDSLPRRRKTIADDFLSGAPMRE
jgi:hypothetical protein